MRIVNLHLALLCVLTACTSEVDKIQPTKTTITESVYSSVTIQPDSLYGVFSIVNGILDRNLVEEGDLVSRGTALAQIINSNPELNVENAKLSYILAQQNYSGSAAVLSSLEKEINNAMLRLRNDSINYFRQKNLWEQKIGSKSEFENRKLAFELSSNSVQVLKDNYKRTRNELGTKLMQSNNIYKTTLITNKDFTIKSKINGKVYALYKNPGEIVTTLGPIASVGSSSVFIIEMLVDEVDIVKIELGQKVLINLDAYNGQIFTANVSKVYPKKDERNQTFTVEALFDEGPNTLYPGLSGEANIIIATKEDALIIPLQYITEDGKVKTEEGFVPVKLGLKSMEAAEVLSGISEETWIIKPDE